MEHSLKPQYFAVNSSNEVTQMPTISDCLTSVAPKCLRKFEWYLKNYVLLPKSLLVRCNLATVASFKNSSIVELLSARVELHINLSPTHSVSHRKVPYYAQLCYAHPPATEQATMAYYFSAYHVFMMTLNNVSPFPHHPQFRPISE